MDILYLLLISLKNAIQKNHKKILILESDIYFCKDFDKLISSYLQLNYHILYLGRITI